MSRTLPNQTADTADKIDFSGSAALLYNQTNATLMCWFRRPTAPTSGNFVRIFTQKAAFNIAVTVEMLGNGGADDGKVQVVWRTPSGSVVFNCATAWDDDNWHTLVLVRNSSSPFVEIFIDGVSDGSSTTDPTTDATNPTEEMWGNGGSLSAGWGGELARCAFIAGTSLSIKDADAFLLNGKIPASGLSHWLEMGLGAPEPDWSGNKVNGVVTGTSIASHPDVPRILRPHQVAYVPEVVAGVAGIRNPMGGPMVLRNPLGAAA